MQKTNLLSVLFLLVAVVNALSAKDLCKNDDLEFVDFNASIESDFADPPPPVFILNELATFNPQLPKVNVITGEYCEEECDLIVGGIEPLSYRRFYGHQEYKDKAYGHWRINPECQIFFNFEKFNLKKTKFHKFVGVGDEAGGFFLYEKDLGNQCILDSSKAKNFTNSSHLSGQRHPLNTKISFQRNKRKGDFDFSYTGMVEEGNGRKRFFSTEKGNWPSEKSCGFWGGVGSSFKEMGQGAYHVSSSMGEWMYADFQYENFNDSSAFRTKSQQSLESWKSAGQFAKAAYDNPLILAQAAGDTFIPGIMDVWHNPTSAEAWGRAAVDVAMFGLASGKVG